MSPSPLCRTQVTVAQVQKIFLVFPSKNYNEGFRLAYQLAPCSRAYNQPHGRLLSPSYPHRLPRNQQNSISTCINTIFCNKDEQKDDSLLIRNLTCSFTVTAPTGRFISVYFRYFGITPSPNCSASHLEVKIWPICFNYNPHIRFTTVPVRPLRC